MKKAIYAFFTPVSGLTPEGQICFLNGRDDISQARIRYQVMSVS